MGYIRKLVDKIMDLQEKYRPDLEEYVHEGKDRVALLRVVGTSGETLLLKEQGGHIRYATGKETPVHIFRCSEDTFLDILANDTTIRKEATLGRRHFTIEDAKSGEINIVELAKWSRAFDRMRGLLTVGKMS